MSDSLSQRFGPLRNLFANVRIGLKTSDDVPTATTPARRRVAVGDGPADSSPRAQTSVRFATTPNVDAAAQCSEWLKLRQGFSTIYGSNFPRCWLNLTLDPCWQTPDPPTTVDGKHFNLLYASLGFSKRGGGILLFKLFSCNNRSMQLDRVPFCSNSRSPVSADWPQHTSTELDHAVSKVTLGVCRAEHACYAYIRTREGVHVARQHTLPPATSATMAYDYTQAPPPFGREMRQFFAFEEDYVNLNHGSYGSLPLPILAACNELTMHVERNPDRFVRLEEKSRIAGCRERIARFVNAKTSEIVLVRNACHGIDTILRNSFDWNAGDVLVTCNTSYEAMLALARIIHDGPKHPTISQFVVQWPNSHAEIVSSYREHLRTIPRHEGQKVVALIDAVTSAPGVLMPWKAMVQACKEEGIYTVVDAAHSIGQETDIDLGAADPDFWVSNCHKWLFAKRGCAVMFVAERNQGILRASFPASKWYISTAERSYPGESFIEQYNWNGTIDFVSPLSIIPALEFREWIGGEHKINEYCHEVAMRGGKRLAEILGTRVLDETGEATLNMVNVELPLPSCLGTVRVAPVTELFLQKMLAPTNRKEKVSAGILYHNQAGGRGAVRRYGPRFMEDFEIFGRVILDICKEVAEELDYKRS
ncbi:Aminotran-5 domain-containing protein [Mycena kentingensis (nom. inval.)]|nr:Aminotran-5 domain-containing protein [Mycena kentingensis (nom. inval.)]